MELVATIHGIGTTILLLPLVITAAGMEMGTILPTVHVTRLLSLVQADSQSVTRAHVNVP